jgi:5-methylthioadenosine/S-adenosylhomocysteine deaminase
LERVNTILTGGTVITMNEAFDVFPDGAVAIRNGRIVAVGPAASINAGYEADEVVNCDGQYVLPGLVNAHTHVPMTLLRGLADDRRLDVWLMGYMMPTEREFVSPEFCRLGAKVACAEFIRGGVTAFADMYYFEADVAAAVAEAGLRGVLGQTILKFPSPDAESFEHGLDYARKFIHEWRDHPLITPAVAPHAPYSSTVDLLKRSAQLAMQYDVPVLIHISEMKQEEEDSLRDSGLRVVPWVKATGLLNAKVLAAHCVHVNVGDIDILYQHDTTVAHCPTSNLKLASGIAPVTHMLQSKVTVGIGTDGTASNNDLDMFEEIRLAAILAKTASNDPTVLSARQALLMATRQGAEALFIGDRTGSLEVGKYADLFVMDVRTLHNTPRFHHDSDAVYSQVVYAGKSTDVAHTMVAGRWLMRDRQLLTLDEEDLKRQAQEYAARIDEFLAAHEGNVLGKLLAVGGVERAESFEIQVKAVINDPARIDDLLRHSDVELLKESRYRQYDTYFLFDDPDQGRVRYREDDRLNEKGSVEEVRTRLTFTSPSKEREFNPAVLLSHSRFIAPADRPLRFYREYFKASELREVEKERRRWRIHYQGVLFFINLDRVIRPALSDRQFIEIKSRTWSISDAEIKAARIAEMLEFLGVMAQDTIRMEYLEMQPQQIG